MIHRPPSVVHPQFFSETPGPTEVRFYVDHLYLLGTKLYIIGSGHMTKMATMPIYGKTL